MTLERPDSKHTMTDQQIENPSGTNNECVVCLEGTHNSMLTNTCGHGFCLDCMREMFLRATKDEELFPPRCCGEAFPPEFAARVLEHHELKTFDEKANEWKSRNRLYCADATCSRFIPSSSIENEIGTCPGCAKKTHSICGSFAHPGVDCTLDRGLQDILQMAEENLWQRCDNCRTMVEIATGCNHITCHCGSEFCYTCGGEWRTCDCPLWTDMNMPDYALDNQGVDDQAAENQAVEDQVGFYTPGALEDLNL
ncbi:hypothetical protein N7493_001591 [Penicillium malachiteum]|uniref:RBR-type E3 ubiquitin transferase n=1 Tax=Penicillium malachiteum TaxID=1324776 RepID=A0AAD6N0H6_9EURO|nr:hypothetical protein N7493_001591 [Penicillium malachiteum]